MKQYELVDHLGNVLATVSDMKMAHSANSTDIDYYIADVRSAQDYYPFGMLMPDRHSTGSAGYKFGFNGKLNDSEISGDGNNIDFGERIFDCRVGRWLSLDPLMFKYSFLSPYVYTANNPILLVDEDGKDFVTYIKVKNEQTGKLELQKVTFDGVNTTMTNVKTGALSNYVSGTNQFVDDMITSYKYIVESGSDIDNAMQTIATSKNIHITINDKKNKGEYYNSIVNYDFTLGVAVFSDRSILGEWMGNQSAALGFWSEIYHAYIDLVDNKKKNEFASTGDEEAGWAAEEEYVHVEKERKVIEKLNTMNPNKNPSIWETKRTKYGDARFLIKTINVKSTKQKPSKRKSKPLKASKNSRYL